MQAANDPPGEEEARFRLDPSRLPQRLELDLPAEVVDRLMVQAERSQRSLSELIEIILAQACVEQVGDG